MQCGTALGIVDGDAQVLGFHGRIAGGVTAERHDTFVSDGRGGACRTLGPCGAVEAGLDGEVFDTLSQLDVLHEHHVVQRLLLFPFQGDAGRERVVAGGPVGVLIAVGQVRDFVVARTTRRTGV